MLMALFIGAGYRTRMSQHLWLAGASVAVLLVIANPPRCAAECGPGVAFYAQHYELLAAPLQALRRLLAFGMWPPPRQLSCFQSCIEAHTFVQVRGPEFRVDACSRRQCMGGGASVANP
jgi:hypothetical protein